MEFKNSEPIALSSNIIALWLENLVHTVMDSLFGIPWSTWVNILLLYHMFKILLVFGPIK